jgi:hypothetical protein
MEVFIVVKPFERQAILSQFYKEAVFIVKLFMLMSSLYYLQIAHSLYSPVKFGFRFSKKACTPSL